MKPFDIVYLRQDRPDLGLKAGEAGRLTPEILEKMWALDARLDELSGAAHADVWTLQALKSHPFWAEIRSQAREILIELKLPPHGAAAWP